MKKRKVKTIAIIVAVLIIVFGMYHVVWYQMIHMKYDGYLDGMQEFRKNKSYVLKGEDGYLYNVKLPDYLTYTGNLCVATEDGKYALLIWPNVFHDSVTYGVQIESENNEILSIMVDENMGAKESYYSEMIEENRDILQELLEKAENRWKFSE